MAFTRPTYDVDNVQKLATLTQNQGTLVKQTMDKTGLDTKDFLTALLSELESIKGAENIGIVETIPGSGTTVKARAEWLKSLIDATALGQVPLGSLTDEYLSNAAEQIKDRLYKHLVDTAKHGPSANMAIYVSTTGNDSTGDGTSGKPYATITKALSVMPKNLNGYTGTINIAAGTYAENVVVTGYHGGGLYLTGSGTVSINSINITDCTYVVFSGTTTFVFGTGAQQGVTITSSKVYAQSGATISLAGTTGVGLTADYSIVAINGTVTLGANSFGIVSRTSSNIYAGTINGGTANIGIAAQTGGRLAYGTSSYTATTATNISGGGRIYSGAQTSVPNY